MTKVYPTPNDPNWAAVKFDGTNDQEVMDILSFSGPLSFIDQFQQLWIFDSMSQKYLDTVQPNTWIVIGPYYGAEPFSWANDYKKMTQQQYEEKFGTSET
jgi:hypothetical protein